MTQGTCSIDGCPKPRYQRRSMCSTHVMRKHRYGDPHIDRTKRRGVCTIEGCGKPHSAYGWCKEHYDRWLRCGNPTAILRPAPFVQYGAAHDRVRAVRGSASRHRCVDCGNQARHWSYNHNDPSSLMDARGYRYSLRADCYEPRCVPCHKRLDLAIIGTRGVGS